MNDFRSICKFVGLSVVVAALGLGAAWADEKVTIKSDEKVTIKSDSEGKITIRHDAIEDTYDESYATITVKTAPPEPRNEEFIKVRPDEKAVWIPGYWRWNTTSSEYQWVSGVVAPDSAKLGTPASGLASMATTCGNEAIGDPKARRNTSW